MVATIWGTDTQADFIVAGNAGDQFTPAVADSCGGAFAVAWNSSVGVIVRFYDIVGRVDPALGTIVLDDGLYGDTQQVAVTSNVALTAGGAGIGYAGVWEETNADASAPSMLRGRYVGLAGALGAEFSIAAASGVRQHDAAVAGYGVDNANGTPIIDGFNVVWVSTDLADVTTGTLTQAQADAGCGRIMLQRFAVELGAGKDPLGPPRPAGLDGVVGGDTDTPVNIATAIGRDPSTIVTHDGETVITWIDVDNQLHLRVFDLAGNDISAGVGGVNLDDIDGAAGSGVTTGHAAKIADLAGAGFAVGWVGEVAPGVPAILGQVFGRRQYGWRGPTGERPVRVRP